jgi:2-polyprenyl-6-methoxyphenol hydroxylase-like FAD-dependent oxidoreductase
MESEVTDLIVENNRVAGVRAKTKQGTLDVRADLVVGADGRHSTVRKQAGFEVIDLGGPIDVLWMRIPRDKTDPEQTLGRFQAGKILVMLNRGDYWQCAYVIAKGTFDEMKREGLPAFRKGLLELAPSLGNRTETLKDWSDISLLSVSVDRCATGGEPDFSASETPRTPCLPLEASASISRFKMPSPLRTRWHKRSSIVLL